MWYTGVKQIACWQVPEMREKKIEWKWVKSEIKSDDHQLESVYFRCMSDILGGAR